MIRMIKHLLRGGADINPCCIREVRGERGQQLMFEGTRPTHCAIANGRLDAVRALLREGADPDAVDSIGRTPLYLAISTMDDTRCVAVTEALLEANASPSMTDGPHPRQTAWTVCPSTLLPLKG